MSPSQALRGIQGEQKVTKPPLALVYLGAISRSIPNTKETFLPNHPLARLAKLLLHRYHAIYLSHLGNISVSLI